MAAAIGHSPLHTHSTEHSKLKITTTTNNQRKEKKLFNSHSHFCCYSVTIRNTFVVYVAFVYRWYLGHRCFYLNHIFVSLSLSLALALVQHTQHTSHITHSPRRNLRSISSSNGPWPSRLKMVSICFYYSHYFLLHLPFYVWWAASVRLLIGARNYTPRCCNKKCIRIY